MIGTLQALVRETGKHWKAVVASSIGSLLEWYDFAIYGYLAPVIAKQFFPLENNFLSLLATFGIFAVGFTSRPLGGLLLGHIGDRFGRKPVLWISVSLMGGSTMLIGCLPDYSVIGTAAPLLLMMLRIFQGLSVGGEYIGSTIYMSELSSPENRGYMSSWTEFGCFCGYLCGSSSGTLLTSILGDQAMYEWGWRVPFWIGGVIAMLGIIIRQHLPETSAFLAIKSSGQRQEYLPIVA